MPNETEVVVPEVPAAEVAAPAPEVTATPDAAAPQPEDKPVDPPKTFTQEEVDALIAKRLAREQRRLARGQQAAATPPAPAVGEGVAPEQAPEVVALAEQLVVQRDQAQRNAQIMEQYSEREEAAREKYADFEQVAYNPKLPITTPMAETIRESEVGPELLYHLGTNPAEAKRISQLAPLAQAKELGKLELKLASNPPARRVSSAPEPITPVNGKSVAAPVVDTTDPRSIAAMDTTTWINKERERQMKRLGKSTTS